MSERGAPRQRSDGRCMSGHGNEVSSSEARSEVSLVHAGRALVDSVVVELELGTFKELKKRKE